MHAPNIRTILTKSMTYYFYREILLGIAKELSSCHIKIHWKVFDGLLFKTFISNHYSTFFKHIREKFGRIKPYFDLWHLKKSKCMCPFNFCNKCLQK